MLKIVLTCFFSQGRHFLIETEDSEGDSVRKADDYAGNVKPLTKKGQAPFKTALDKL